MPAILWNDDARASGPMIDVLVAGAGPAGSIAALLLARLGARVVIVDRDEDRRASGCPGLLKAETLAVLDGLSIPAEGLASAHRITHTEITGPRTRFVTEGGSHRPAKVVARRELDRYLLRAAVAAGARFQPGVIVRRPLMDDRSGVVRGLVIARRGGVGETRVPAVVTIGADGRHSRLARAVGVRGETEEPRWAFSTDVCRAQGANDQAELHVRQGWYLMVVPTDAGVSRWCAIFSAPPKGQSPASTLAQTLARDPILAERFRNGATGAPVSVAGPVSSSVAVPGSPGLLLAGDAAGAVDPLTTDGLLFAIEGGRLAAEEAARVMVDGSFAAAPWRLASARREAFGAHWRLNRWVTRLAAAPVALDVANRCAVMFPSWARRIAGQL
jgi:menaquinone-9 beta-reductase